MVSEEILKQGLTMTLDDPLLEGYGAPQKGKVRNSYVKDGKRYIVTSDRISAFDRVLGTIPYKGQVLNRVAAFWFEKTKDLAANHLVDTPDPAVMTVLDCTPMPVEMVVRAYITGSTSTSIWTHYQNGVRNFCGNPLPDGLKIHQKLDAPILTPSTKAEQGDHDVSVSREEILAMERISAEDFDAMAKMSMELFAFGQEHCAKQGLILVDTKYEFGEDKNGNVILADEVHTPDSSRYWVADTYEERLANGEEPQNFDKEFLRLWFTKNCDPYKDEVLPDAPADLVEELSYRYIDIYEQLTGKEFKYNADMPIAERIQKNLDAYFS